MSSPVSVMTDGRHRSARLGAETHPDWTTALMAWQVIGKFFPFLRAVGLDPEERPDEPDLSHFVDLNCRF
jgi:hypothetical protein